MTDEVRWDINVFAKNRFQLVSNVLVVWLIFVT